MRRKKAFITGAASGIGRVTAKRFANEGFDVCINDIQTGKLKMVFDELPKGDHILIPGSYTEQSTLKYAEEIILKSWGRLDVLVNSVGIYRKTDFLKMEIKRWRVVFDTMVNGCLMVSKMASKLMCDGGRMIHITSIHGMRGDNDASSYSMAKSAINQFCRSMAVELSDRGILVNAIAPGFVNAPLSVIEGQNELETKWFKENYVNGKHLPLRRAAEPEEIAGVALFLAGKDSTYITGQVIVVDGGLTITF